jgi:hypothetical protein
MMQYVSNVLAPANLTKLFPEFQGKTTQIVGFGWDQGWNDGCGVACTDEYEQNSACADRACVAAADAAASVQVCWCHFVNLHWCVRCLTVVNLIGDLRKAWNNPKLAISIPVSGFGGWGQTNSRRLGIIDAQFGRRNT